MKLKSYPLLSHVAFLLLTCFAVQAPGQTEFLGNPGFEQVSDPDKFPDAWDPPEGKGICTLVADAKFAHRGSHCLKLEYTSEMGPPGLRIVGFCRAGVGASQRASVAPGQTYRVAVWAKGKGVISFTVYELEGQGKPLNTSRGSDPIEVSEQDWQQYEYRFTPSPGAALATVGLRAEGVVFVDEFSFTAAPAATQTEHSLSGEADLPKANVPPLKPTIDGKVEQAEWKGATSLLGMWGWGTQALASLQTRYYLGFDDQNLYVAFESPYFNYPLKADIKDRDGPLWQDDSVEIFLQPGDGQYYQFVVNSAGAIYDGRCVIGKRTFQEHEFNAAVEYKTALNFSDEYLTRGYWVGELKIPFAELGIDTPQEGAAWRANFCRTYVTGGSKEQLADSKFTLWSLTQEGGHHAPERFGQITFTRLAPVISITRLSELAEGSVGFAAVVSNPSDEARRLKIKSLIRGREEGKVVVDETSSLEVPARSSVPVTLEKQLVFSGGGWPLSFQYEISDASGAAHYRNTHHFTSSPGFRLDCIPILGSGMLHSKVDIRRLGGLPADFKARLEIRDAGDRGVIKVPIERLSIKEKQVEFPVSIAALRPGRYQVKVILSDNKQDLIGSTNSLTIPETPEWLAEKVGVTEKVPPPWTPLKRSGQAISCLGRQYIFQGAIPFPSAVENWGEQILHGPMEVEAVVGGRKLKWGKPQIKILEEKEALVRFAFDNTAGPLTLTAVVDVEFDGFIKVDWTVTGGSGASIDSLVLNMPLTTAHAQYLRVKSGDETNPLKSDLIRWYDNESTTTKGYRWSKGQAFDLWLGGDDKGLSWTTTSYEHWHSDEPIVVTNEGEFVNVAFRMIDGPMKLDKPLQYVMALNATPARPRTPGWSRWHNVSLHKKEHATLAAAWTHDDEGFKCPPESYPHPKAGTPGAAYFHSEVKRWHDLGLKWFITTRNAQGPGGETPAFRVYGEEWKKHPVAAGPIHGTLVVDVCANTSFTDFYVWDARRVVREFDVDGFFFDSSGPMACSNRYHGCGWWSEEKQEWVPTYDILGIRELYKRLYVMFLEEGKTNPFIYHHGIPGYTLAHFADLTTYGEFMENWGSTEKRHYPFYENKYERFRAWFAANQYGVVPFWYYSQLVKAIGIPFPSEEYWKVAAEATGICLLHNMEVHPETVHLDLEQKVWRMKDEFDIENGCEWILYTKSAPYVRTERDDVVVSLYKKRDKALLIVGNSSARDYAGKVVLNLKALGFSSRLSAVDKMDEAIVPVREGSIEVEVPGYYFRAIQVEDRGADPG